MPALHAPVLRIPSSGVFLRAWPRFLVATPPTGASGQGGPWDPCLQIQHVEAKMLPLTFEAWFMNPFFGREKKEKKKKTDLLPHLPINIKQLKGWRIQHVLATTTFLFLQVLLWEKQIVCHAFLTPGLRLLKPLKTYEIVQHSFQADWKKGTQMMTYIH